ncbi:MAG TPA: class I SAM-dependent methyltransferase [Anaerolineales bacterium]
MTQEVSTCLLCGSNLSSLFDRRTFRDFQITNRICDHCGLVYESPRMTEEETDEFYKREYRLTHDRHEGPTEKELAIQRARANALFNIIHAKIQKITRNLEIGCSAGFLLVKLKEQYHCDAAGIEPGIAFRDYAINQNLKVYSSMDELVQGGEERFDLITMSHVLEHLVDPIAYLVRLRESLLTQDGRLFIEVPNLYAHDCFEFSHLYSFSAHTLQQVLQQSGFQIEHMVKHGQPRSRFTPLYINVLARPDPAGVALQPIEPERDVRIKRRTGIFMREFVRVLTFPGRPIKRAVVRLMK